MDLAPMFTPVQHLGDYIREQRTAAQISLRSLAAKAGVSNPYLSQVERGLRRPSAGVLAQIAQGLQISTESLLIKAGILHAADASPVLDAIRADQHLSDHHKTVLIEIYTAFRREAGDDGNDVPASANAADEGGPGRAVEPEQTAQRSGDAEQVAVQRGDGDDAAQHAGDAAQHAGAGSTASGARHAGHRTGPSGT